VEVHPADDLSERFPQEMPYRLRVLTKGGGEFEVEKSDYESFSTRPISRERAEEKFERLTSPYADGKLVESIEYAVRHLEEIEIRELTERLGKVGTR
jgi:2-methylcitrate dehydratase